MYCVVITLRGEAWLAEGSPTPTHQALAALVSPPLEATQPRAIFDAFCLRLSERLDAPQPIDECRNLWRALGDNGLIAVRGSLQLDAGRAFALKESLIEGARPHKDGKRYEKVRAPHDPVSGPDGRPATTPVPNRRELPLIRHRVSSLFRDTAAQLMGTASDH
jgi:hypothetical protein